ncbi:transcription initiation Spt4 [Sporormia fimetaria CBS 119925]|uniref:Transcription elongation factor SPT4 n=1 Tax=Sporormia fimetaria CBS 119925 TaxID=1340428 RepID=A0A6A6UZT7_9PLEO|nr:transcription initiation Spt4 [Sporormia fimetaria CBS 119925]
MASGGNFIESRMQRHMRACMVCSVVRTAQEFTRSGCPNCDFLQLAGNPDAVAEATSPDFEGLITISDTERSWVARYQRLQGCLPGVYAMQVMGVLAEEYIEAAEAAGVHYVPRDGSATEAVDA